jgi:hypothetical protein
MFRWKNIEDKTLFDMTVKMYRDPFVSTNTFVSPLKGLELDHYAYRYMQSELFMYRILDTNFESFIEERGDMSRVKKVCIPADQDLLATIL